MLDNDISFRFADMLRALEVDIVALRKAMPSNTKDVDFLGELSSKHSVDVFISNNTAQRTNLAEVALLKSSGVTSLYFNKFWGKMKFWPQAVWLLRHWETIQDFSNSVTPGTCADIQSNGKLSVFHL
jgi:hypothetical protein